jgi:hypothetical protein
MDPLHDAATDYATPMSLRSSPAETIPKSRIIPKNLTQAMVDANAQLKRFQQDLLILTSFCENDTLHWRPSWFPQDPFSATFWTLYNPPNVVTELLPHHELGRLVYTRRMRRPEDSAPLYIQTWEHWYHVCNLRGIPHDFLCEEQVKLLRLGLPRNAHGMLTGQFASIFLLTKHIYNPNSTSKLPSLPRAAAPRSRTLHALATRLRDASDAQVPQVAH